MGCRSIVGRQPLIFQLLTVFQIYQRTILMQFLRRMRCTRLDSHNISTAKTAKKLVSVCTKAQRPLPPPRIEQKFDFVQFCISNNQESHALPFLLKIRKTTVKRLSRHKLRCAQLFHGSLDRASPFRACAPRCISTNRPSCCPLLSLTGVYPLKPAKYDAISAPRLSAEVCALGSPLLFPPK